MSDRKLTSSIFEAELGKVLREASHQGHPFIVVRSGDVHRAVGSYPGPNHRMPVCCGVMERLMRPGDKIIAAPPKGRGANLYIGYLLPRE